MNAKELMQPLTDHLRPDDTIGKAAWLLKSARRSEEQVGVKALPVLDAVGTLVGILSIGDILKAVHPAYLNFLELGAFTWDGMVESFAKTVCERKVADIMTRDVIVTRDTATLMMCIDLMLKHNVKRVPVLDEQGRIIGMLYERDIFYAIVAAMPCRNEEKNS